jgi:hypothetical protein
MGGLGNQMFQYAAAKALAKKLETKFALDLSFLKKDPKGAYTKRDFELDAFKMQIPIMPESFENYFIHWNYKRFFNIRYLMSGYKLYKEKAFVFDKDFFELGKKIYLIGIFQNEKYFTHIRNELLIDFQFRDELLSGIKHLEKEVIENNSVAVHVRRGDYIKNPNALNYHGICSMDYYTNAMNYMKSKINSPVFYIFSDDIEYCKKSFKDKNVVFMENQNAYQDMHLMKTCRHHIIANSSFSWWGAWLSEYPEKMVIAPKYWLREKEARLLNVVPENWLVMD